MYIPKETPVLSASRICKIISGISFIILIVGIMALIFISDGKVLGEKTDLVANVLLIGLFMVCFAALVVTLIGHALRARQIKYTGNMVYYNCKVARLRDNVTVMALSFIFLFVTFMMFTDYVPWLIVVAIVVLIFFILYGIVALVKSIRIGKAIDRDSDTKVLEEATDLTPEEISKMLNDTLPAVRTVPIGYTTTTVSGHLYEAVVKTVKPNKRGHNILLLKMNWRGIRIYRRIVVLEGIVPKVGATILINISRWTTGRGAKKNSYEREEIIDIDALREVYFDWNKLQESLYGVKS